MNKRAASAIAAAAGRAARAGRAYAGLSHEERVAQRRARFVQAGIACFGRLGYHASTVRAICAEAGLTDRYFYESFRGTEDLLAAAFTELAQALLQTLLAAIAEAGEAPQAGIDACLQRYFAFMRDPLAARVLLMEVLGVSPTVDALYQRTNGEFAKRILVPWIEAAGQGGPPRARGDDRVLSIALAGAVTSAATLWVLSSYRQPAGQMVANCRRVIEGALRSLGAPR
jgi:AcrR family transcriptional regulator